MAAQVSGTEGYAENAASLIAQWQGISFADRHQAVQHLLPQAPSCIADIGTGIGTDAAALAAMGHSVVAVEPVDALRDAGMRLHASPRIEWVNDSLPNLARLRARHKRFNAVMLTAVWMHLDAGQRRQAMRHVHELLAASGVLIMSLRHGPVPAGRRMFEVSARETIALAGLHGLRPVLQLHTPSVQPGNRRAGVTWTRLVFRVDSAQTASAVTTPQATRHL